MPRIDGRKVCELCEERVPGYSRDSSDRVGAAPWLPKVMFRHTSIALLSKPTKIGELREALASCLPSS